MGRSASETHYGYAVSVALGTAIMPWDRFGLTARVGYGISPALTNELGETHLASGLVTSLGLRLSL